MHACTDAKMHAYMHTHTHTPPHTHTHTHSHTYEHMIITIFTQGKIYQKDGDRGLESYDVIMQSVIMHITSKQNVQKVYLHRLKSFGMKKEAAQKAHRANNLINQYLHRQQKKKERPLKPHPIVSN